MSQDGKSEAKRDYSSTLQLPQTTFSMKANLLQAEPKRQEEWEVMDLYRQIQQKPSPKGKYVFHDGPPYANGPIHMGHLMNKILKDLVVRSRIMDGYSIQYVPGWDCHGLPIEHRVMKELGEKGKELDRLQIRRRCQTYAAKYVDIQSEQMKRLGTLADYADPYLTMKPEYEGAVLEVFAALVAQGIVYRDVKPVHWSIANQTALAEAELEYYDRVDTSVYVFFEIVHPGLLPPSLGLPPGERAELMIWTTTPWTLPANLAVAVGPNADYGLYRTESGGRTRFVVLAEALGERVLGMHGQGSPELLGRCSGTELAKAGVSYLHPFVKREGRVVIADYVTLEDGTGLVHTAPGHGAEDYFTGIQEGLPIYCPVLSDGTFDETAPEWLQGIDVWTANGMVVEHLRQSGHLFHAHEYSHSYPHDWRSKTPTIFRATEQWFIAVDRPFGPEAKSLRQRAMQASLTIRFVPDWGRSRLQGMLEARPDWCISRQRAWGLPIPALVRPSGGFLLTQRSVKAIARTVRAHGSDCWFRLSAAELLADYDPAQDPDAPDWARSGGRAALEELGKGNDIFDVWFESGSSWNGVIRERNIGYPADLYLEGSDQHRGWFQLSLLPALGATGVSPFKTVLTHGFMVDAEGRKMSKSLGNAVEVADVLKMYGADICRWWVSSLNYTNDIKVDWEFFKISAEEYRKVRNTVRFLLSNLNGFDPGKDAVELGPEDSESVDAWVRQRLSAFVATAVAGYREFDFKKASEAIFNFCNDDLSAVYLAAVKDRLYCDRHDSRRRRRCRTTLYRIADTLIRVMAPILVHTAEEAWAVLQSSVNAASASVHLQDLPQPAAEAADARWEGVMEFRQQVLKAIEVARGADSGLKNPLDAGIEAALPSTRMQALEPFKAELADLCGVSRLTISEAATAEVKVIDLRSEPRCERSWKRDGTVRLRSDGGWLSDRDAEVVGV